MTIINQETKRAIPALLWHFSALPMDRRRLLCTVRLLLICFGVACLISMPDGLAQGPKSRANSALTIPGCPPISAPPDSLFDKLKSDRDLARQFYKKYLDIQGLPVTASREVGDLALQRTWWIVTHMLAGRPDILQAMVKNGTRLIIIGKDQVYTDMPEYRNSPNPQFQNERVRGTGGFGITSFGEENLLSLPLDRYDDESIAVHEFCHTIDAALRAIDPGWVQRRNALYETARKKDCYRDTYAGSNSAEYWAEIAQAYFDCNRINNWNHGPVGNRKQLESLDPDGYQFVKAIFNLKPEQDWRYTWVQKLPNVTVPPAKFNINPYYTKFTWAREFTVIGREASDAALLKANDTIRKMFAYRHDILKALIAEGLKLVVLGKREKITRLPEIAKIPGAAVNAQVRVFYHQSETKLLAIGEEYILGDADRDSQLIRLLALAVHKLTGMRPVDPDWDSRPRGIWQQYELRLQRMDIRFDQRLREIYVKAMTRGAWRGLPATRDTSEYWAAGVLAYFNAAGRKALKGAVRLITTREMLQSYDPELYALVNETMAYQGHIDWRYSAAHP